jgi:hypothetical protein
MQLGLEPGDTRHPVARVVETATEVVAKALATDSPVEALAVMLIATETLAKIIEREGFDKQKVMDQADTFMERHGVSTALYSVPFSGDQPS